MDYDTHTTSGRKGRPYLTGYEYSPLHPIRSVCLALLLSQVMPALFFSCVAGTPAETVPAPVGIAVRAENAPEGAPLDIFVFETEHPGLLDAYERVPDPSRTVLTTCSRSGEKRIVAVANGGQDIYGWSDIRSYENFSARTYALSEDDPDRPVMAASAAVTSGGSATLSLQPLLAEIRVHSLCCDFHARPYAGAQLENIRIYLTNVRDRCRLDGESVPSWINGGRLDPSQTEALTRSDMVCQTLPVPVGEETVFPGIRLFAYPNLSDDDAIGSPLTRLVIEGTLLGKTCYYPLSIRPLEGGKSHVFDITLTRAGTSDPDIPATSGMVRLDGTVAPWNEMEPLIQTF